VIANQNVSSSNTFLGYDGPSSTFMAIAGGALLRWTGTAWESINSTGTTVPGTLVYDDERKLILAVATNATDPVRIWEWSSTSLTWVERMSPVGNVRPTGVGTLVTAGVGKMAFVSGAPIAVGEATIWIWDAATATWSLTRSSKRPYIGYASPLLPAAYAGQGRVLLAGPSNWDRQYEPAISTSQPAFLNLVTPTWEWTLP
jgi:hypothetical protein